MSSHPSGSGGHGTRSRGANLGFQISGSTVNVFCFPGDYRVHLNGTGAREAQPMTATPPVGGQDVRGISGTGAFAPANALVFSPGGQGQRSNHHSTPFAQPPRSSPFSAPPSSPVSQGHQSVPAQNRSPNPGSSSVHNATTYSPQPVQMETFVPNSPPVRGMAQADIQRHFMR